MISGKPKKTPAPRLRELPLKKKKVEERSSRRVGTFLCLHAIVVAFHQDGLVAPLKEVSHAPVMAVETLGIHAVHVPHALRQVAIGCLDQQVIVIVHQAIGMAPPAQSYHHVA